MCGSHLKIGVLSETLSLIKPQENSSSMRYLIDTKS